MNYYKVNINLYKNQLFKPENNIIIEDYMQTESRKVATVRAMAMTFANSVLVDRLIMMRGKDEIVT